MTIAAGYLTQNMDLSPIQQNLVLGAHLGMWVFDFMGICNSFWGTKGLPMVSLSPHAKSLYGDLVSDCVSDR